jgi:hypothetical protein
VGPDFEYEFWALISEKWINATQDTIHEPFALVESGRDTSRRIAYYANTTYDNGAGCRCVDTEGDPFGQLMVSRGHMHLVHQVHPEHSYFAQVDHCQGHAFVLRFFPQSPPPPDARDPPPAPPYYLHEVKATTGAFAVTGLFFMCFCGFCGVLGLTTAVRGHGRSKWWGTRELAMEYHDAQPDGRHKFAATGGSAAQWFSSLPAAERRLDTSRPLLRDA